MKKSQTELEYANLLEETGKEETDYAAGHRNFFK